MSPADRRVLRAGVIYGLLAGMATGAANFLNLYWSGGGPDSFFDVILSFLCPAPLILGLLGFVPHIVVLIAVHLLSFVLAGALLAMCFTRRSTGSCPNCSYNLTGNASGSCPECGRAVKGNTR